MNLKFLKGEGAVYREIPVVYFAKTGLISLNSCFCELAELNAGDYIDIGQNIDSLGDWYITKTNNKSGVKLRIIGSGKNLGCNYAYLIHKLRIQFKWSGFGTTCKISKTPLGENRIKYWLIITSSATNTMKRK